MGEPMRSSTATRRFWVSDAMILTAATAAGLAWYMSVDRELVMTYLQSLGHIDFDSFTLWLSDSAWFSWPMAFTWTLACFILALRRPRPDLRRLTRRPGFLS